MRSIYVLVASCCVLGTSATARQSGVAKTSNAGLSAQVPNSSPQDPQVVEQQVGTLLHEGRYLAAIRLIERADPAGASEELRWSYRQLRPALDGIVVPRGEPADNAPAADGEAVARYQEAIAKDAISEIVQRAKKTRVVIINETHDNPRDRAFVLAVAEALRPLGYNVYAAEGFTNFPGVDGKPQVQRLIADGYARYDTGFYMVDPMFAYLVRRVLQLGYRPLPYEYAPPPEKMAAYASASADESIALREQGEAENLARAIAAAPPGEKFLVHVGYSHAAERPVGPEGHQHEWMAARLARLTGIDPLTIDQTGLSEYDANPRVRALYARLVPRVGNSPKVFLTDGQATISGQMNGAVDLQVVHPPIEMIGGRPNWLQRTDRRAVRVPSRLLPKKGSRLVQVFVVGEASDAVPVDQVLVTAGREAPLVYLPPDKKVRWAVQDD